jgi:hypothetical protein
MIDRALLDTQTGQVVPYPRADNEPVVGLDPRYSVLTIVRATEPEYDPETQRLEPTRTVVGIEWRWGWEVEDLPPMEPDYQAFYGGLLASQVYQGVVGSTGKTGDQAAAMAVFVSALQDALSGRVNPAVFQGAIWLLLSQIQLSTEGMAELQALVDATGLGVVYSLVP